MSVSQAYQSGQATSMAVYNLPSSADETEVQSIFPSASMCILQFNNARDCQQAYDECLQGKEVGGQLLYAELNGDCRSGSSENISANQQYGGNSRDYRRSHADNDYGSLAYSANSRVEGEGSSDASCTLTVSNLPYTASERDIMREFPEALRVALSLDEQGRSRGVAHVTFSNSDQCSAALSSCGNKMMGGRPVRGRIQRDQEHNQQSGYNNQRFHHRDQRDYGQRNQRDYNQRNFNNRDHTNQRENGNQRDNNQRDYSGQRDYNRQGRQFDYNSGRGERDVNRFQGGQTNRGGPRDFGRNDRFDRSDQRRDRSPARGEPVRGYGSSKGPRITSAVIHRPGNASPSESSSSEED
ncbi:nucleolin [Schistosoma japonicum]|uniref:Nucleolin n=1 Tax=Schistosoma japonicum TaxID=6182 RepID=A0A4Z2CQR7_SCHJA|nr:nucleolin [Schistosoma japonicum]